MIDEKFDKDDLKYYLEESSKIIDKEVSINDEDLEGITEKAIQTIVEPLQDLYVKLRKDKDDEFEDKMRWQRYERGYADSDVWNLNSWFMETLYPMLKTLRETHSGSFLPWHRNRQ